MPTPWFFMVLGAHGIYMYISYIIQKIQIFKWNRKLFFFNLLFHLLKGSDIFGKCSTKRLMQPPLLPMSTRCLKLLVQLGEIQQRATIGPIASVIVLTWIHLETSFPTQSRKWWQFVLRFPQLHSLSCGPGAMKCCSNGVLFLKGTSTDIEEKNLVNFMVVGTSIVAKFILMNILYIRMIKCIYTLIWRENQHFIKPTFTNFFRDPGMFLFGQVLLLKMFEYLFRSTENFATLPYKKANSATIRRRVDTRDSERRTALWKENSNKDTLCLEVQDT